MMRLLTIGDFYRLTFPLMMRPVVAVLRQDTSSVRSSILDLSLSSSRSQMPAPASILKSFDLLLDSWASRSSSSIWVPIPLPSSSAVPEEHLRRVFLLLSDLSNCHFGHSFRVSHARYGTATRDSWKFQPLNCPQLTAPTSAEQSARSSPASDAPLSCCQRYYYFTYILSSNSLG